MRFGAIDIGSNAVRLLVADITEKNSGISINKQALIRIPIRLGASVFETGSISNGKAKKLAKTLKAFTYLLDVYEAVDYRVCATSAMREAENSAEVVKRVKNYSGMEIEIIEGRKEADLIYSTFSTQNLDLSGTYLYIDVGGGSTEITLLKQGKRIKARSFRIGTVRILKGKVDQKKWAEMRNWVADISKDEEEITAIGTGGNINRIFKMSRLKTGELLNTVQLKSIYSDLTSLTFEERVEKLQLRPDRADVIIPAGQIYLTVLLAARIEQISVPKIGLSDGIALYLYNSYKGNKSGLSL